MLPSLIGVIASSGGAAASATSYESIATVTVGSGGSATIEFTSIPSTYQHLQIRGIARQSAGGVEIGLTQFNSDTGSNYARHGLIGNGSTVSSNAATSQTSILVGEAPSTASTFGCFILDILDYANTSKYKTTRTLGGYDLNGSGEATFRSGLWMSTSAISSVKLTPSNGTYSQYSSFALYGIKG